MAEPQLTPFERILLGMVCLAPSSGYDLKRTFGTTPMGVYQPSSGALYPALRRLTGKGMVRARAAAPQPGEPARHRRVYEPTPAGRAAHVNWLRTPIDPATVSRDLGLHLMRFAMMEHLLAREEVLEFLQGLIDALAEFLEQLRRHAATADLPGRHPLLAIGHGMAVHQASLQWARDALAELSSPSPPDRAATAARSAGR